MGRNKRVLVLNHFAAPRGEAGGTRHVELFSRLVGWEHLIIASDLNPQTGRRIRRQAGFAVVRVPSYSTNGVRRILNWLVYAMRAAILGLRQGRVDVVYGSSPHLLSAFAAWLISFVRHRPFVLEIRDLWPKVLVDMGQMSKESSLYAVLSALEDFLYSRADAIVFMAEGTRVELVSRGVAPDKLYYIPNGADPDDFRPSEERRDLRDRYGFSRFTAVYTGAHGPANGLDLLINAAEELRDDPVDIVLVGGGIAKSSLVQTVAERGLSNVRFMEPIPKNEMPDLLAAADLGIHCLADVELFRSAVSPNKVFDYMAAGLPVVTNCPGVVTDLIEQASCGYAVPPHALDVGIRRAEVDSDRQALGRQGSVWISRNQSRSAMAQRLTLLLERIAE